MKLVYLLSLLPFTVAEVFPQTKNSKSPTVIPFQKGESLPISCISRNIDNGEHKFDEKDNIIYESFPVCQETGEPFTLKYGESGVKNCTITLTDEIYHLFQLYIHQDVPFSCRLPYSKNKDGISIPLTLNFRGIIETSHLDIDTTMNILVHSGGEQGSIISSIGYSAGANVSRYIIGDSMPIRFHINWFDEYHLSNDLGHFDLSLGYDFNIIVYIIIGVALISGLLVYALMYGVFNKKLIKELGYKPGYSTELGIDKRD
ncbi:putative secreted protein [Wickerhamomyces ciferrii]|uniref:Secreted protein n=1 Tax=Wickerhamomyces ciferrii (strain ATCC 14091 / BCRC 22168 / CBS 111 / JCM 3599 / NBRC 0793 / NRRL Y-1031 F-60-10) TaxID=1206466 RepID=K0KWK0_WICCF|nr:uncharacterized protein BN7_5975 [Wickerhamomyces ciferrii]CCH46382.1 putative secreted protein [Wickerhamomyces ciferrii]